MGRAGLAASTVVVDLPAAGSMAAAEVAEAAATQAVIASIEKRGLPRLL